MRTIGVVTVGRSDYGIYLPILHKIQNDPDLRLHLIVAGMHLAPEWGLTVRGIEADGFPIGDRVEMLLSSDTPVGIAKSIGLGVIGFAQSFARKSPDVLIVLGDRFEMYSAAVAALPFKIPIAHIHGGELTVGAIDDALRHSLTKLSHLHFVATKEYAHRVIQLGEEPWRITISGAPSLDNIHTITLLNRAELEEKFALHLARPFLLVTFHPVTLEFDSAERQINELLAALEQSDFSIIFTMPNADTGNRAIRDRINKFTISNPLVQSVENLGTQGYFSLMSMAAAMVGNSSSGIIEAASFRLPVVNLGIRQQGRTRGSNVIDTICNKNEILSAINRAVAPEFRTSLEMLTNVYGQGNAAETIVKQLKEVTIDDTLLRKNFQDIPVV